MKKVQIGCEAYIIEDNMLLLGKRVNVYGSGTWALVGGHLEFMERADNCLARELKEEMGLILDPGTFSLLAVTDDLQPESDIHYIHITYRVPLAGFDPGKQIVPPVCEPDSCEEWRWFPVNQLPKNIFPPHEKILKTIATNRIYLSECL
ncbi:MAG TPA: NUDIX domain-containing protein [Candidatus Paceibacterota bacterium]|nr:NUDIX domain-containing protein [Candidatus Paceibacterota bacterium]HMO82838.1 NUDIX domain-containing protein [Candidatus Paceibacterota bacterium]